MGGPFLPLEGTVSRFSNRESGYIVKSLFGTCSWASSRALDNFCPDFVAICFLYLLTGQVKYGQGHPKSMTPAPALHELSS